MSEPVKVAEPHKFQAQHFGSTGGGSPTSGASVLPPSPCNNSVLCCKGNHANGGFTWSPLSDCPQVNV